MKITRAELRILNLSGQAQSRYRCTPVVCRIYTNEGVFGDGEATTLTGVGIRSSLDMLRDISEMILGLDPLDTEAIWNKIYCVNGISKNGGPFFYAPLSAIDIALWDIKGKSFGVPVYKLLGGKQRDSLRCYASMFNIGWGQYRTPAFTPQDFVDRALEAVGQGFTALKADYMMQDSEGKALQAEDRTGHALPDILDMAEERIAAVREAVGPGVELMVEGHGTTDAAVGLQFCHRLKKYGVIFYEEPCNPFLPACAHLSTVSPVPIAGGERLYTRFQCYPYMESHAYQYFQPDIGRCGGITEMKKIIDLADMFELPVQLHCSFSPIAQAAVIQVEAAMNRFVFHEHTKISGSAPMRGLGAYDCLPENGMLPVLDRPGIGNELTENALNNCEAMYVVK